LCSGGDRVGVAEGGVVELGGPAAAAAERGGGRHLRTVTSDHLVQDPDRGELLLDPGQHALLPFGVDGIDRAEHDVDVVLVPAAGQHCVQHLPVLAAVDDAVDDVGGQALRGVDG
jgi:hypothetical protein